MVRKEGDRDQDHEGNEQAVLEEAKRIMRRLTEMPHKPHKPPVPAERVAKRAIRSKSGKKQK